jgi:hypothetical protein
MSWLILSVTALGQGQKKVSVLGFSKKYIHKKEFAMKLQIAKTY